MRLGFRHSELNNIQSRPSLFMEAPDSWPREILTEWLLWAPGDARGSTEYASLSTLKRAVGEAGLGRIVSKLHV